MEEQGLPEPQGGRPAAPANAAAAPRGGVPSGSPLDEVSWLQRQRVQVPGPVEGFLERPELERRCALMGHRLTVLSAPGGFGKTVLLAHRCRRLRQEGVCVAWLSLDEDDGPLSLATYLLAAFEQAGLAIFDRDRQDAGVDARRPEIGEMDSEAAYRLGALIAAVAGRGVPCLLALDEVERASATEAVRTLNVLLERAPANLHFAMAYRSRPAGLDIATPLLAASGAGVSAEELRFSESEIARFFGEPLAPSERGALMKRSAGWPLALRMLRNAREKGEPPELGADTLASWIETRLWRGLAEEDRELVLDMALFDWFSGELLDEVLESHGSAGRIAAMSSLAGLLQTASGDEPTMRLHPLIRDYGAARRLQETPDRYHAIHAAIARSLARRGQAIAALHHAVAAGDMELAGRIAERAGCLTTVVHEGSSVMREVVATLRDEVYSMYPRLELTRCLMRACGGDLEAAETGYRSASTVTSGFTRDRPGGDDRALRMEHMLLLGMIHGIGCRTRGMAEVAEVGAVEDSITSDIDHRIRDTYNFGLCFAHSHTADFGRAVDWGNRARAQAAAHSHVAPRVHYELGQLAMAEGRPESAAKHYADGVALARSHYLRDSGGVAIGNVLTDELLFEQTGGTAALKPEGVSHRLLGESVATASIHLASLGVGVQQMLWLGDTEKAAELVEDAREFALRAGRPLLAKHAAALHVLVLLAEHRVAEATRAWQFDGLPEELEDCLNIQRRGWRQTEMLACTRVRLCAEHGAIDSARELAAGLRGLAESRGLKRTAMRGAALATVVALRAGDEPAAMAHLAAVVDLHAETGYTAGLAADRDLALPLLYRMAEERASDDARQLAAVLGGGVAAPGSQAPTLTSGELEVLARVAQGEPDKGIAEALKLSADGVRYRLRTAFAKLGVRSRFEAVHRARQAGHEL